MHLCTQVQELQVTEWPDLFREASPEELRSYLGECPGRDDHTVLVAVQDGHAVGYLVAQDVHRSANPLRHAHHTHYIHQLDVDREARRAGAGPLPMTAALDRARDDGCTAVKFDSLAFNTEAHAFFERTGFHGMNVVFEHPL